MAKKFSERVESSHTKSVTVTAEDMVDSLKEEVLEMIDRNASSTGFDSEKGRYYTKKWIRTSHKSQVRNKTMSHKEDMVWRAVLLLEAFVHEDTDDTALNKNRSVTPEFLESKDLDRSISKMQERIRELECEVEKKDSIIEKIDDRCGQAVEALESISDVIDPDVFD